MRATAVSLRIALVDLSWPGYHSLGLAYIRAFAEADPRLRDSISFNTMNLSCEEDPWWIAYRLDLLKPDVVGFSVTCFNAHVAYEAAKLVRAAHPEVRVVLGGPEVGPIAEEVLRVHPHIDFVVRGEGEQTFADLASAILDGNEADDIPGVTRRVDGSVASGPDRPPIEDLDSIPSPILTGALTPIDGLTFIETYRGCPNRCAWCYEGKGSHRIRSFSKQRIAAEIDALASAPGVKSFSFIDPVFNLNDDHLEHLTQLLESHAIVGLRLHTIEVDLQRIEPHHAGMLSRSGVVSVEGGPQTIGARSLAVCNRKFDPKRFKSGVDACRSHGIRVQCDLIVGLPGDDFAQTLDNFEYVLSIDPGRLQVSTLHVLPGTELWDRAEDFGIQFDRQPPHIVVRNRDMDFGQIRQAEAFGLALTEAYKATI